MITCAPENDDDSRDDKSLGPSIGDMSFARQYNVEQSITEAMRYLHDEELQWDERANLAYRVLFDALCRDHAVLEPDHRLPDPNLGADES